MTHGHKHDPGKARQRWQCQQHGLQLEADSPLLLEAHHHHLTVEQTRYPHRGGRAGA